MKAMILAAGRGMRLRPLTDIVPKALVPVVNRPIIERTIELLALHGAQEIIVNAYHHSDMITNYLRSRTFSDVSIEVRMEEQILGTGGGIKNTQDFWDTHPFMVINGDILTDINLREVYAYHQQSDNLATMVLHDYPRYNNVKVDENMNVLSFDSRTGGGSRLAFTGIHVLEPEVLDYIPAHTGYSIIDCYRRLIQKKGTVGGYVVLGYRWNDIGTIRDYIRGNFALLAPEKIAVGKDSFIDPEASINDGAVLGSRCSIARKARVQNSILWNEVTVSEGAQVVDSVITGGVIVNEDVIGGVVIGKGRDSPVTEC